MNKNRVAGFLIGFFIAVGLGGCSDPFHEPEQSTEEGTGRVQVRIELKQVEARTFLPTIDNLYFTLEFTAVGETPVQESLSNTEGTSKSVILAPGTWDLRVKAYQDEASVSSGDVLLEGTVTGILVSEGASKDISVSLSSLSEKTGEGTLEYTVSFPSDIGVKTGTLTITKLDGSDIRDIVLDETGGSITGSLLLPSGMYRIRVALDGAEGMVRSIDIVHIFEGLNTPAVYSFESTDFVFDGSLGGVLKALEASTSLKDAYTFELVPGNETLSPTSFDLNGAGVSILIDGQGRTISLGETGALLSIENGVVLTLKNMTLQGGGQGSPNTSALVRVAEGGVLNLGEGVLITNNYNSSSDDSGGGVYVAGGSFTIGSGARIEGNAAVQQGGGVYVASGTFRKEGGIIKENTAESGRGYGVSLAGGKYRNEDSEEAVFLYAAYDGSGWIYSDTSLGDTTNIWEMPIKDFWFEGLNGLGIGEIDEVTKTITVVVLYEADLTQLVPVIEISSGVTVSPGSRVAQNFTEPVEYEIKFQGGVSEVYRVSVTKGLNTAKAITGFRFTSPEVEGSINEEEKSITVVVPYGTDPTNLTPAITISPAATVSPASDEVQDFTNPIIYTVTAQDGSTEEYTVTITVALNTAKAITSFRFEGLSIITEGIIDETAKTIQVTVPYGTSLTSLSPTIMVSPDATVSPGSEEAQNFTNPVTYLVTAQDGTEVSYTVSVLVTNLGVTIITTADMDQITLASTYTGPLSKQKNTSFVLQVVGGDTTKWFVDGSEITQGTSEDGLSCSLYGGDYSVGVHYVMVLIIKDGIPYSTEFKFRVTE